MIGIRKNRIGKKLEDCRFRLFRVALSWTRNQDQAEELIQDSFVRALDNLDQLRDESRLEVWVTSILANIYRDSFRRFNPEFTGEDPDQADTSQDTPERYTEIVQACALLENALGKLKPETRQVITLVDIAGFSYAECAEILSVPAGTVMSRLSRGRDQLLAVLKRNQHPSGKVVSLRSKL